MSDRVAVFSTGRLEQVAPPLEIYNRPASRFVGEFIGDSNFFEARADPLRPGWIEVAGIGAIRVGIGAAPLPASGELDLLVRPERIRMVDTGPTADLNVVQMTVETIVNYGDSVLAIGTAGGRPLRMRVAGTPPAGLREGAQVTVGWAPQDAYAVVRS